MVSYEDIVKANFLSANTNGIQRIENSGQKPLYIGFAEPGSAVTSARWQIRKVEYDGDGLVTSVTFASGTNLFDKVWNDRATYSYS